MANKQHIELVKKGSQSINEWRKNNPGEQLDLTGASLYKADLLKANFSGSILGKANFEKADMRWVDLSGADLSDTNFTGADMYKADFHDANATGANFTLTNLEDTDFSDTNLKGAVFDRSALRNTNLKKAINLEKVIHRGLSLFDSDTLRISDPLPQKFLDGSGVNKPRKATVYRVLIGSPGDVHRDRAAVREAVYQWNDFNSQRMETVLLPVLWEIHSVPEIGKHPQLIIDKQLVDTSRILICLFWSRLGTPTPKAESGTVHEMNKFFKSKKNVLLYFCNRPLPQSVDENEWIRLKSYKAQMRKKALWKEYSTPKELKTYLQEHLTKIVENLKP